MLRFAVATLWLFVPFARAASPASVQTPPSQTALYTGWLQMYDLKFDEAHRTFADWKRNFPADPLGPASNAAAWLFSELARLGALESEFFINDSRFEKRPRLNPDPAKKALFLQEITEAETLADAALGQSADDLNALFVKSLACGLRADNAGLVEKQNVAALNYTKEGRTYAERVLASDPHLGDAWLGPGVENYLLSLKPAPMRVLLRMTGSSVDREKGLEQLRETAAHGHYLEPFAKLLLAVAAMRDKNVEHARDLLSELHRRFPDNDLYTRELNRLPAR
jgi:hypothetical protein